MRIGLRLVPATTDSARSSCSAHRPAGLQRQQRQRRLHGQLVLAAEGAAGRAGDHPYLLFRHAEDARKLKPVAAAVLAAGADVQRTVRRDEGIAALGLHEAVHLARRFVDCLDDMGRAGERRRRASPRTKSNLHCRLPEAWTGSAPATSACLRIGHHRQRLVFDLDEVERALGGLRVDGSDCGDRIADVPHLVEAERRLVLDDDAEGVAAGDVAMGDDGRDARQRLGRASCRWKGCLHAECRRVGCARPACRARADRSDIRAGRRFSPARPVACASARRRPYGTGGFRPEAARWARPNLASRAARGREERRPTRAPAHSRCQCAGSGRTARTVDRRVDLFENRGMKCGPVDPARHCVGKQCFGLAETHRLNHAATDREPHGDDPSSAVSKGCRPRRSCSA